VTHLHAAKKKNSNIFHIGRKNESGQKERETHHAQATRTAPILKKPKCGGLFVCSSLTCLGRRVLGLLDYSIMDSSSLIYYLIFIIGVAENVLSSLILKPRS
jgi:hypothetical protein